MISLLIKAVGAMASPSSGLTLSFLMKLEARNVMVGDGCQAGMRVRRLIEGPLRNHEPALLCMPMVPHHPSRNQLKCNRYKCLHQGEWKAISLILWSLRYRRERVSGTLEISSKVTPLGKISVAEARQCGVCPASDAQ